MLARATARAVPPRGAGDALGYAFRGKLGAMSSKQAAFVAGLLVWFGAACGGKDTSGTATATPGPATSSTSSHRAMAAPATSASAPSGAQQASIQDPLRIPDALRGQKVPAGFRRIVHHVLGFAFWAPEGTTGYVDPAAPNRFVAAVPAPEPLTVECMVFQGTKKTRRDLLVDLVTARERSHRGVQVESSETLGPTYDLHTLALGADERVVVLVALHGDAAYTLAITTQVTDGGGLPDTVGALWGSFETFAPGPSARLEDGAIVWGGSVDYGVVPVAELARCGAGELRVLGNFCRRSCAAGCTEPESCQWMLSIDDSGRAGPSTEACAPAPPSMAP